VKDLQIFLNNPNVFYTKYARKKATISPIDYDELHRGTGLVLYNGKQEIPQGILISWGVPGVRMESGGYYYNGRNPTDLAIRKIKSCKAQETKNAQGQFYEVNVTSQKKVSSTTRGYYNSNRNKFAKLVMTDRINEIYLNFVEGLDEEFNKFANLTEGWWLSPNPNNVRSDSTVIHNGRHLSATASPICLVDVTDLINGEDLPLLNTALEGVAEELYEGKKLSEYTMYTHKKIGFYDRPTAHVYRERVPATDGVWEANARNDNFDNNWIMVPQSGPLTIKSWVSTKDAQKIANEEIHIADKVANDIIQDFTFKLNEKNFDSIRVLAIFEWECVEYTHTQVMRNNRRGRSGRHKHSTPHKVFLPKISGFCLQLKPKANSPPYCSVTANQYGNTTITTNEAWEVDRIQRVANRTKKRSVKGGYKGGYQGINKLILHNEAFLEHDIVTGLQSFAKGAMIQKYELGREKRIPLSLEQYQNIERPNVDVKPIEIGHLRFYRLSNPPKRQVTAEILSDLLLPSMPALLIATDTDVRVVSNSDTYQNGENCSGACDKQESVETTLPPGLYLVDRQTKCALGHDPGRKEYTSGFGDECNETITVRRLLSQFNVFYDQFRGNMVGQSSNSLNSGNRVDNSAFLGRLG